jgi:hypothetical protein
MVHLGSHKNNSDKNVVPSENFIAGIFFNSEDILEGTLFLIVFSRGT